MDPDFHQDDEKGARRATNRLVDPPDEDAAALAPFHLEAGEGLDEVGKALASIIARVERGSIARRLAHGAEAREPLLVMAYGFIGFGEERPQLSVDRPFGR